MQSVFVTRKTNNGHYNRKKGKKEMKENERELMNAYLNGEKEL